MIYNINCILKYKLIMKSWNELPFEVWLHIANFLWSPCYKFVDWVDVTKLRNSALSKCPKSIDFLLSHLDRVVIYSICDNPNPKAQLLLWHAPYDIDWAALCCNKAHWAFTFIANFETDLSKHHKYDDNVNNVITHYPEGTRVIHIPDTFMGEVQIITSKSHFEHLTSICFSSHPRLVEFLMLHPELMNWSHLSQNPHPNVIKLLKINENKIDQDELSSNTSSEAVKLLSKRPWINWYKLSSNPSVEAIALLKQFPYRINVYTVAVSNTCPQSIELLEARFDQINWVMLAINIHNLTPHSLEFLLNHIDNVLDCVNNSRYFEALSKIPHSKAIDVLRRNPDKIVWNNLIRNPHDDAIELIKEYNMINWNSLANNKSHQIADMMISKADTINPRILISGLHWRTDYEVVMRFLMKPHINLFDLSINSLPDYFFELDDVATELQNIKLLRSFNIRL